MCASAVVNPSRASLAPQSDGRGPPSGGSAGSAAYVQQDVGRVRDGRRPGVGAGAVDDTIDSGRTLTVVGAALREAGSGPVHPFALAKAATG
jgi:hypothetical protein